MSEQLTYGEQRTDAQKAIDEFTLSAVKRGMALLERKYGADWVDQIDPAKLSLEDGMRCVLGQVFDGYGEGCEALGLDSEICEVSNRKGTGHYGFVGSDYEREDWLYYPVLNEVWQQEIAALKGE